MLSFLYVYSDHSILECYNLFSGVELSMRLFFVITRCVTESVLMTFYVFPDVQSTVHNVFKIIQKADCAVMDPISDAKKTIPSGTYAGRQLLSIVEGIVELNQFEIDDQVTQINKLKGITEMIINLDELNNSINLKDGRPSNELLTYHVTDDKDFTHLNPKPHNIGNLKMESLLL